MVYVLVFMVYLSVLYAVIGYRLLYERYTMFLFGNYWTDYNTIEFISWIAKAIIIIPGLVFGIELWYMHFVTLVTSSALIWASMRKRLPTLILFNTIWICISLTIILKHILSWL